MRVTYILILFGVGGLLVAQDNLQRDDLQKVSQRRFREVTPRMERVIERGLAYLARKQSKDGSFRGDSMGSAPVATTSMACLAFMGAGHFPGRGKYGENVKRGLKYILRCTSRTGYINEGSGAGRGSGGSGMHGHGFAMLFLAEVYGNVYDEDLDFEMKIKNALKRAVKLTAYAQAPNGGWTYDPEPRGDEGSVTITQVAGLRAARNAGISVPLRVIKKGKRYIFRTCNPKTGLVRYRYAGGSETPALTAAGMSVLTFLGEYKDKRIDKGLRYLLRNAPWRRGRVVSGWGGFTYYLIMYASIAMFQRGGSFWRKWWPPTRNYLIKLQRPNGSFEGDGYGGLWTAFALITLEIPYRYLSFIAEQER
jgi:prenyltransferase beta subunit